MKFRLPPGKKTFTFLLLLLSEVSFSQNLVPNWSFEDTVSCPSSFISNSVGWSAYRNSPDYFNICNNTSLSSYGVPTNAWGFQYPKSGNAYVGLAIFHEIASNGREYPGVQLIQPLIIGQNYFASIYVSRAVSSNLNINVAANKIGIRLSTVSYSNSNPVPIDNYAHVYTDSIIIDTLNWVKIAGSFVADSAYNYLSIGNFFDDSLTATIPFDSAVYAYYYFDDICLSTDSLTCNGVNGIIENNNNLFIHLFPNPASDWIEIWGNDIECLMLFDVLGRICFNINSKFIFPQKINVSFFPRGIYLLKAITKNKSFTQKIILK